MKRIKEEEGEVHALDLGCGAGLFSVMAAKSGATSVVACDMHEALCAAARKVSHLVTSEIKFNRTSQEGHAGTAR